MKLTAVSLTLAASIVLSACGDMSALPESAGFGPKPTLPAPQKSLIPTVNIAPAMGWPSGTQPTAAAGVRVSAFKRAGAATPSANRITLLRDTDADGIADVRSVMSWATTLCRTTSPRCVTVPSTAGPTVSSASMLTCGCRPPAQTLLPVRLRRTMFAKYFICGLLAAKLWEHTA